MRRSSPSGTRRPSGACTQVRHRQRRRQVRPHRERRLCSRQACVGRATRPADNEFCLGMTCLIVGGLKLLLSVASRANLQRRVSGSANYLFFASDSSSIRIAIGRLPARLFSSISASIFETGWAEPQTEVCMFSTILLSQAMNSSCVIVDFARLQVQQQGTKLPV